jgi:DNA-binding MarR family transcriptional regulator
MSSDPHLEPPAIGALLRLAWHAHRSRMFERLAAAGYPDVTRAQFALFRWPGVDGMRPGEVAELAGLSKQAVNDTLGELERSGYLERHPDPHDGRARIVRLTDRGRTLQDAAHETSRRLEAAWAASLGEERFAVLRATLQDMIAAGERPFVIDADPLSR